MAAQYVLINPKKFREYLDSNKIKYSTLSLDLGFGHSFISNAIAQGRMPMYAYKLLVNELNVDYNTFLDVPEPDTNIADEPDIDLSEVITAINKLGNIEMQNMEYLKKIYDLLKEDKNNGNKENHRGFCKSTGTERSLNCK